MGLHANSNAEIHEDRTPFHTRNSRRRQSYFIKARNVGLNPPLRVGANLPRYAQSCSEPYRSFMENVVLIIHLILALGLIAVVLLQRSEGGGLGMGGGGGGAMTGRAAATALGKVTWALAIAFICTSMTLTIFAAENASGSSVIDRLGVTPPAADRSDTPGVPESDLLLPPSADENAPLVPTLE
ncbi:preprotein translocase SecG-like protein [Roseobacter litoralis Och 149]|uniref:Protein-export membrane protein SecG n=2 Tax=Roseobacteraceae TaxID=2854170 RepID=F7ZB20_ROSLO|nr:preprotein translocase SecG-like protein [Roseobacter litoralis Och 149]